MRRREFIGVLGGAAAWPLMGGAHAQQAMPMVGFLHGGSATPPHAGFRRGLNDAGYREGRNVAVDYRYAEGQYDRLPELAADLVRRQVTVLNAAGGLHTALAAQAATTAIPIVFSMGSDPVKFGLVVGLNRPGGNITGVNLFTAELESKRLGLLHELVRPLSVAVALVNPSNANAEDQISSNCHLVAGRSLIDLVASRLALRAPALGAATALTRPNRSARWLPCGRHVVPTTGTVGPNDTVANHRVERGEHLAHHRHDGDFRQLAGGLEPIVERLEPRIPIARTHRRHVEHVADIGPAAPDAASSFELAAVEGVRCNADERSDLLAAHLTELGQQRDQRAGQHGSDTRHGRKQSVALLENRRRP